MLIFNELKKESRSFYPAILLEEFVSYKGRKRWRNVPFGILSLVFLVMILAPYADQGIWQYVLPTDTADFLMANLFRVRGLFFIIFVIWFKAYLVEGFYLSHYFRNGKVDFEVARLVYLSDDHDMTLSFLKSKIGQYTMDKLGIPDQQIDLFAKDERRRKIRASDLKFYFNARKLSNDDDRVVNLPDYSKAIFDADQNFRDFLARNSVSEEEFFGALEWVQNIAWKIRNKERFWNKENLMQIPGLGRNWFIGHIDYLEKYTHLIYENEIYKSLGKDWPAFRDEAEMVQSLLLDKKLNNVLLVADNVTVGMEVVSTFGKMIAEGRCLSKFENKKMYILSPAIILSHASQPEKLKKHFIYMVQQAENNPDAILVFPDFANFFEKSLEANIDIFQILKEILKARTVPFIAITDKADFFSVIEPDFELMKYFDKYVVPKADKNFVLRVLQNEAHKIENKDKKNITFPVLNKIAEKNLKEVDPLKSALHELHRIYE